MMEIISEHEEMGTSKVNLQSLARKPPGSREKKVNL